MPSRTKQAEQARDGLPEIPKEVLDQFVTGPMTAEAIEMLSTLAWRGISRFPRQA